MSNQSSRIKSLKFAAILSLVCSILITGASAGLKKFQLENMELDRQKNILKAADMLPADRISDSMFIKELYSTGIREVNVNAKGEVIDSPQKGDELLQIYFRMENGKRSGYIIPIETRGLWGKIYGYLAFEKDGSTVMGFTVYSHSETPGLGGEIESEWFGKNFKGKKIINRKNKFVSVGIAKGRVVTLPEESRPHNVDGISGATLTGKYLSQGIRRTLEKYEPVSVKFRQIAQPKDKRK